MFSRTPKTVAATNLFTISLFLLSLFAVTFAQDKPKVDKPVELSELSSLKAENFKLKAQFAQCQIDLIDRESKLASSVLTGQQSKLEVEFMNELGCDLKTQKFNWQTLACDAKTPNLPIK
jgi:hypothetical protein